MLLASRWCSMGCTILMAGLLITGSAGCNCMMHSASKNAEPQYPDSLLPPGFGTVPGHYNPDNPDDHINGYPTYIVSHKDNMIMAYVPSQTILMGGGTDTDEVPARTVTVNHFYIDIHEVTNKQFHEIMGDDLSCCRPGYQEYWIPCVNDDHPVRNVSWFEANSYAVALCKVLPTEAQWEAAARSDDHRIFPWGNEQEVEQTIYLCNARTERSNYDGYEYTAPVMSYAAGVSPYGVFQMAGNVWEWCRDHYDPGRYAYPSDEDPPSGLERGPRPFGDVNYPSWKYKDIREARVGPMRGSKRVVRGGSFAEPIERCRVESRAGVKPDVQRYNIGFRCILPLKPKEATNG